MPWSRQDHKRTGEPLTPGPPGPAVLPPPRLVVLGGDDGGTQLVVDRPHLVVGRSPSSDLVLTSRRVSGRHAHLESAGANVVLHDDQSTNGTWVNGERLAAPRVLRHGDLVTFAEVEAVFQLGQSSDQDPAATSATSVGPATSDGPDGAAEPDAAADTSAEGGELLYAGWSLPAEIVPADRPRTVLVCHAVADRLVADLLVALLQRAGHLVWVDRSQRGDGWGGRLLDTVWSCDLVVWVVSPAAATSARVHREVHLAGSERTPVLAVSVDGPVQLPPDLAYYVTVRPAIDLTADPHRGMRDLLDAVAATPRKRIARPRRLAALAVGAVLLAVGAWLAVGIVLG